MCNQNGDLPLSGINLEAFRNDSRNLAQFLNQSRIHSSEFPYANVAEIDSYDLEL